jgi:hypothetical protein
MLSDRRKYHFIAIGAHNQLGLKEPQTNQAKLGGMDHEELAHESKLVDEIKKSAIIV